MAALLSNRAFAEAITMRSLLSEMTDLRRLAEFPSPAYTTRQSSSNDPRSTSPADREAWFANNDSDNFHGIIERSGRTERVLMRAKGPGAIVRIWSANPVGTLRIYIDGREIPALEASMESLLGGKEKHLGGPISGVHGRGFNLYLPIPYATSCEVTNDTKGFYYSVDYRTYAPGTEVISFKPSDIEANAEQIEKQGAILSHPEKAVAKSENPDRFALVIGGEASSQIARFNGPLAISEIAVQVPPGVSDAALRSTLIVMRFDGEKTVEVPFGDFFGSGPGINPFESLPLGMSMARTFYSHWFMPFRESAVIELKSLGKNELKVRGTVGTSAYDWSDRSLYFHAGYRSEVDRASQPPFDWNYLTATGRGRFVGASFAIDNPVKGWWGEGDEKFYVDGEAMPSWFGTGSEDYFGYAWASPDTFSHAYHNQPRCDGPVNYGRTSVNRFHILDDVPFERSFKFDMEIWHWAKTKINFAATTYWYAASGGTDDFATLKSDDVRLIPMPAYKPLAVEGAIEGEQMAVLKKAATVAIQEWEGTSGEKQLLWSDAKVGEALAIGFDVGKAGKYIVAARFLHAADYGVVRLAINDVAAKQPIDLYHDGVVVADELVLGTFDLRAGQNTLELTIDGENACAIPRHLVGLDYILLQPAQ